MTFIPLRILYQFKSYFYIYQLVVATVLVIPYISPLGSLTALPFAATIILNLILEAIEDYVNISLIAFLLEKTMYDLEYNNSKIKLYNLRYKSFIEDKWKNLHVGAIIKVMKNDILPADIIVIKSSSESGFCYLSTSNLDG